MAEVAVGLEARDRAFAHELAYGVTRLRGRLDHLLAAHVHRGLDALEADVLEVLRLGAYQALYMGSVPDYAAVSASVEQARALRDGGSAGLVNAVLRKVARAGDDADRFPPARGNAPGFLTTWGSHPEWLVRRWLARWTPEEVTRLITLNNRRRPPAYLVPLHGSPGDAAQVLEAAGVEATPVGGGTDCVRLGREAGIAEALRALPRAIVQDPAANLVVRYADIPAGTKVADLCAAPGGKALVASGQALYTLAADRSEPRMRMLRDNADRTGARLGLVVADATCPPVREIDAVLLDVPCSGTGTFARHPDARWRLDGAAIDVLATVQRRLLNAAADAVAPGGLLVYSTCTLEPEENERQVEAFLDARADFQLEAPHTIDGSLLNGGYLSVLPHTHGFDGAFAARLRRCA